MGCGAAPDAAAYGDAGADTLGHVADACAAGHGDRAGLRQGVLRLPNLSALGLGGACTAATGRLPPGLTGAPPGASFGFAIERSAGKDTPSGHWEMAGTPVPFAWGVFPPTAPCFPPGLDRRAGARCRPARHPRRQPRFGHRHHRPAGRRASPDGTTHLLHLGRLGLQIAAHEETFGLERLYAVCRIARRLCDPLALGRIIARPFLGSDPSTFHRTANRRDYAVPPPPGTLFERAAEAGRAIVSVGKTADIFAHRFTGEERKGHGNDANLSLALDSLSRLPDGGLVFANLVDFDSEYGHRRDVPGYAACLEAFDARVPAIRAA